MKNYVPKYWLEEFKRRNILENTAMAKVDKEPITQEEKKEVKMFISGGLYDIAMNFLGKYRKKNK